MLQQPERSHGLQLFPTLRQVLPPGASRGLDGARPAAVATWMAARPAAVATWVGATVRRVYTAHPRVRIAERVDCDVKDS